jgi:hypothetical protein
MNYRNCYDYTYMFMSFPVWDLESCGCLIFVWDLESCGCLIFVLQCVPESCSNVHSKS